LRIKEPEKHLIRHEHDDDNNDKYISCRRNSYTPLIAFVGSGGNYLGVSEYIN
jgi:hypothetical protein